MPQSPDGKHLTMLTIFTQTDQLIMPLEALEPDSDLLALANYTEGEGDGGFSDNGYLPHEKIAEGLMLMFVGIVGILLNLLVLILTLGCSNLRIMMNGFTVHGCFVDIFKVSAELSLCANHRASNNDSYSNPTFSQLNMLISKGPRSHNRSSGHQ